MRVGILCALRSHYLFRCSHLHLSCTDLFSKVMVLFYRKIGVSRNCQEFFLGHHRSSLFNQFFQFFQFSIFLPCWLFRVKESFYGFCACAINLGGDLCVHLWYWCDTLYLYQWIRSIATRRYFVSVQAVFLDLQIEFRMVNPIPQGAVVPELVEASAHQHLGVCQLLYCFANSDGRVFNLLCPLLLGVVAPCLPIPVIRMGLAPEMHL